MTMHVDIPFVDRVKELNVLLSLARRGRYLPLYIYGPEGCGKTRLLIEFASKLKELEDYLVVYIDALSSTSISSSLIFTSSRIVNYIKVFLENVNPPLGRFLALSLDKLIEYIEGKITLRGRHVVLLIDDVATPIGLDKVSWYVKYLQELGETILSKYRVKSILIIATTSEGKSFDHIRRHSYADIRLLWNLNKKAALELMKKLNICNDTLWNITGGNPRAIIEIVRDYEGNVNEWVNKILKLRVKPLISIVRSKGLVDQLRRVCKDIDLLVELHELRDILINENMVLYIDSPMLGEKLKRDEAIGIGELYAWQLPVFKDLISKYL